MMYVYLILVKRLSDGGMYWSKINRDRKVFSTENLAAAKREKARLKNYYDNGYEYYIMRVDAIDGIVERVD